MSADRVTSRRGGLSGRPPAGRYTQLQEHDDRQQFLAGMDIFLAGIMAVR